MTGEIPERLYYTKQHEWLKVQGEEVIIGITDYAQEALGDLVFVELPDIGQELEKGEAFSTVESVKAASEVYAPVNGEVTAVNTALADNPELVNEDPYGKGWLVKCRLEDEGELEQCLDAQAYRTLVDSL